MSANVGRQRQHELRRKQRADALRPFLEPGWRIDSIKGEIVAVPTVLGHHQRGQQLLLRCSRPDCRRRCEVDLRSAIRAGLGERPIQALLHLHRCQHWQGCDLKEEMAIYPGGVPLVAYVDDPDQMVSIVCLSCGARWLVTPADAIRRLKLAGTGDGNTGILMLAKLLQRPCRACGVRQFETGFISLRKAPGSG